MLNNFVLIGKIKKITLTTRDTYTMTLTTTPPPQINIFTIELPRNIGKNVEYYTKEGDTIGVKGYLKAQDQCITLVADRVTFLQQTTNQTNNNQQLNKGEI